MNQPLPAPIRPQTLDDEWDDPAMAQLKREEAEDREAFGRSDEAKAWLEGMRSNQPRWSGSVTPVKPPPVYNKKPVRLYAHETHA
jgi:hypothetical protein